MTLKELEYVYRTRSFKTFFFTDIKSKDLTFTRDNDLNECSSKIY